MQIRRGTEDPARRGCLIVNTIAELGQHSAATRALARGRLSEIRGNFLPRLTEAGAAGEVAATVPAEVVADACLGAVVAVMTLARSGADPVLIRHTATPPHRHTAAAAVALLGPAGARAPATRT